jgi:hypothetical protein
MKAQTMSGYGPVNTSIGESKPFNQFVLPSKDRFAGFDEGLEPTRRPSAAAVLGYYLIPGRRPSQCTRPLSEWDQSSQPGHRQSTEIIVIPDVLDEALEEVELSYRV